jgi:hypothetical protein
VSSGFGLFLLLFLRSSDAPLLAARGGVRKEGVV